MLGGERKRRKVLKPKSAKKVAAGKRAWANKSPEEKEKVLARLAAGRIKRAATTLRKPKKPRKVREEFPTFSQLERQKIHQEWLSGEFTKAEARLFLTDLRRDLGLITGKKATKKSYIATGLPPLKNPLPRFFAKNIKRISAFLTRRKEQHFGRLTRAFIPVATALGFIPPASPAFRAILTAYRL